MKEFAKAFYRSKAWKRIRAAVVTRAAGLCERCQRSGIFKPGKIAHHKIHLTPENINDPKISLNIDLIEYICEDCHNKEHKSKSNKTYTFDSDGRIIPRT
jgi:5-methylcytosine-specific restriction endonuclease McrA